MRTNFRSPSLGKLDLQAEKRNIVEIKRELPTLIIPLEWTKKFEDRKVANVDAIRYGHGRHLCVKRLDRLQWEVADGAADLQ